MLGVAFDWSNRKGMDIFARMAMDLDDSYQIVMVGVNEKIKKLLPSSILSINRIASQTEMAKLYSVAEVYVNPTKEETFSLTNVEALACGTPVVTFRTGGSSEMITDKTGIVIEKNNYTELLEAVRYMCENTPFSRTDCRNQAENYNQKECFANYLKVYEENGRG